MFQKCILPPSSEQWWRQYPLQKRWSTSMKLEGTTPEKAVIFILAATRTWNLITYAMFSSIKVHYIHSCKEMYDCANSNKFRNGWLSRTLRRENCCLQSSLQRAILSKNINPLFLTDSYSFRYGRTDKLMKLWKAYDECSETVQFNLFGFYKSAHVHSSHSSTASETRKALQGLWNFILRVYLSHTHICYTTLLT
jgi:hypothetical protein